MHKMVKWTTCISVVTTVLATILYQWLQFELLLTLAISLGTTAYHFSMRLLVGGLINLYMRNRADYNRKWYQPRAFEARLYQILGVKKWKNRMPTYQPKLFSPELHTYASIAQTMCQAELVHEVIVVLSFLPLLGALNFGAFPVFLISSIAAAVFDLLLVIIQRYNRPRVLKLMSRRR